MTKHVFHVCRDEQCVCCNGGLAWCDVCGGAEASLPTGCPGQKMTGEEADAVQSGFRDYQDGAWVRLYRETNA